MNVLELIFSKELLTFTVGVAALSFLTKSIIKHFLSKDVEAFKTELKAAHDKDIERLKADLRVNAHSREVAFARLYEKRADLIAESYCLLTIAGDALQFLLKPVEFPGEPTEDEKLDKAGKAVQEFIDHFQQNRIYFPKRTTELFDNLETELRKIFGDIHSYRFLKQYKEHYTDAYTNRTKAWDGFKDRIPSLKLALEEEFRAHLEGRSGSASQAP